MSTSVSVNRVPLPANTNSNIPGTLVLRDGSGNFAAGTITASLNGTASAIADNSVTSAKIVDGTIVNADVNASAAIAGTKIAPDFGSGTVQTNGSIQVIQNAAADGTVVSGLNSSNRGIWAWLGNIGSGGGVNIGQQVSSITPPVLSFYKSRGGNTATPTVVSNGDGAGSIQFKGYDGSGWIDTAAVAAQVDGTPGTNDMPGRLIFSTTAGGASSPTERIRITSAGNVGIANVSPTERLHVTGNIKASGFIDADTSFRGQPSDSVSAPSFTWTGDTDTGMLRPNADTIEFTVGGSAAMRITSTGGIGIGSNPSATALLDLTSTTRGFLPPRMTGTQRDAISTPPAGLMLYNSTTNKLQVRTNNAWVDLH
jgi:hypothetical protein